MDTESLVDEFVTELKLVQGKAPNTLRAYRMAVEGLENLLYLSGKRLEDAEREDILAWRQEQDGRASAGIALDLAGIRSFYKFLSERGIIQSSPVPESMTVSVKSKDVLAHSVMILPRLREIMRRPILGEDAYDPATRYTVFEVLIGAGLRASAALSLRPENLNLEGPRPCIVVEAEASSCKGKRAGVVPITPLLCGALKCYLESHPKNIGERLFDLCASSLRAWLRAAGKEVGIQDLHPHALRKVYGSCLYFKNLDGERFNLLSVKAALGHASVETTMIYVADYRRACSTDAEWCVWNEGLMKSSENVAELSLTNTSALV